MGDFARTRALQVSPRSVMNDIFESAGLSDPKSSAFRKYFGKAVIPVVLVFAVSANHAKEVCWMGKPDQLWRSLVAAFRRGCILSFKARGEAQARLVEAPVLRGPVARLVNEVERAHDFAAAELIASPHIDSHNAPVDQWCVRSTSKRFVNLVPLCVLRVV